MVFSSLLFMFRFLPVVFLLYYVAPRSLRNIILFVFSLFFYAWGEPKYVFLMLFSITMDYFVGKAIDRAKTRGNMRKAKRCLLVSIIVNLSILGFFKYADFLIGSLNAVTGLAIPLLNIPLPIGISFFTFQTMSYTIDVYKGTTKVQKNWIYYGTYVSMFPQLIAGPIVQYKTIAEQMEHRRENTDDFTAGISRFMCGVGKKVLLANNIGLLWDSVAALPIGQVPALTAWLGALAFTFQIYFDFSGYSDMAIGLGKMFGFHFLENFEYPYKAKSITEFWRRWHISLSSWFKEYVYIPLGGNRCSVPKQVRNIAVVWLLTGVWHGASWNYVLWGVYYGILLLIEKFALRRVLSKLPSFVQSVYTLFFVILGWVIFKCEDLSYCLSYLRAMFGGFGAGFLNGESLYLLKNYGIMLLILMVGSTMLPKRAADKVLAKIGNVSITGTAVRCLWFAGIFLISVAYLVDATYNPFLYFRF
ncbi:MAG TPA: MBOAT family protein [Candidatus Limivivens merdigallinarum]|uniref:MBOAT family protein n=1 Tax=Candidatus Limivivens merdigallinarum TaxID=2840859 RepID=A0A9D0ZXY9_9FIRM|nr:MBOAT family protein [Candidatus Limivivens merdigallinarum]